MHTPERHPFLKMLYTEVGPHTLWVMVASLFCGLANSAVVICINNAAKSLGQPLRLVILFGSFLLAMLVFVIGRNFVLRRSTAYVELMIRRMRMRMAEELRVADPLTLEQLSAGEVFSVLTKCTQLVSRSTIPLFLAMTSAVMLVGCLVYMCFLSLAAAIATVAVFLVCARYNQLTQVEVDALLEKSIRSENAFFGKLQDLLDGIKEVKLSRARSNALYREVLLPLAEEARTHQYEARIPVIENHVFGHAFFYIIVAAVLFLLPALPGGTPRLMAELIALLLFMRSSLEEVVGAIPILGEADVAMRNLFALRDRLAKPEPEPNPVQIRRLERIEHVESVAVRGLSFRYPSPDGRSTFGIGPLDLEVRAGEITLVHGANGAGKSTLLKVLTGLYEPDDGEIYLNGQPVNPGNRRRYREFFSAVFSDFHVFRRLYGLADAADARVLDLLEDLELAARTDVVDRAFTNVDLSTGQRKRLAFLVALLEERPVCVFDEVAADQDPEFRARFYREILPRLKAEGKAILLVSHDKDFFDVADRMYAMDYGTLQCERDRERRGF